MGQLQPAIANDNGDHIEADVGGSRPTELEPSGCEPSQASLFPDRHGFGGKAEVIGCARLDLTEHDDAPAGCYEVELAHGASEVPIDDTVAVPLVEGRGGVFAQPAQIRSRVHMGSLGKGCDAMTGAISAGWSALDPGGFRDQVTVRELR